MKRNIKISALSLALLFSVYYFLGTYIFAAFVVSVLVHELGHVIGILLCGGKIENISLKAGGFYLTGTGVLTQTGVIISLFSGPLFGFVLAAVCAEMPLCDGNYFCFEISRISFVLSVYNLLPAVQLDGGRILDCLLAGFIDTKNRTAILNAAGIISGAAVVLVGAVLSDIILVGAGLWLLISQTGIVKNKRVM